MARVNVSKHKTFFFYIFLHPSYEEEKQRKRARVFTPCSTYTTANRKVTGITATFQSIDLFNMIIPRGFSWLIFLLLFADKSLSNLLDFFFSFAIFVLKKTSTRHLAMNIYIRDPKDAMPFYFPRRNGNPPLSTMTVLIGRRWWRSITVIIQRVRHGAINRVRRVRNPTIR